MSEIIKVGMADLKTEYREALYLVSLEGMSYREAARILGKSEQNRRSGAYYAAGQHYDT